jgi:hypothetical protein
MNCPKCGEDWSDVAVVRNAKREALAATPAPLDEERLRRIESAARNPRLWYALIAVEEQGMKPEVDALRAALAAEETES